MFHATAAGAVVGTDTNLDSLIDQCLCDRDVAIWENRILVALILAPAHPSDPPIVLRRHELMMAGLVVVDRWTLASGLDGRRSHPRC